MSRLRRVSSSSSIGIYLLGCLAVMAIGCDKSGSDSHKTVPTERSTEPPVSQAVTKSAPSDPLADTETTLESIANEIAVGNIENAQKAINKRLIADPGDEATIELNADLLWKNNSKDAAIEVYRSLTDSQDIPSRELFVKLIDAYIQTGQPFSAVATLKNAIEHHPRFTQFHYDIAGISAAIGVTDEGVPSLQTLIMHGQSDIETVAITTNPGRVKPDWQYLFSLVKSHPEREELQLGLAAIDVSNLRYDAAATKLEMLLERRPNMERAQLMYGKCLVEINDAQRLRNWVESLQVDLTGNPEYWNVIAKWSQNRSEHEEACRAYWEALSRDPSNFKAMIGLHQSLLQLGRQDEAQQVATYIELETQLRSDLNDFFEKNETSQRIGISIAQSVATLGRPWVAEAWARHALRLPKDKVTDVAIRYKKIRKELNQGTPWQQPEKSLAIMLSDLADFPKPQWRFPDIDISENIAQEVPVPSFQDEALARGYEHSSLKGVKEGRNGFWIYQTVGGGVSVVDFDLDGWPDLASAVLNGTPMESNSDTNELHRNVDGSFVRCDVDANYVDTGFGQGIAIGDVNGDGFPDMIDLNIGENRYFQNNGDGTFSERSAQLGLSGARWSTSGVIADLNSDGSADFYESCYCDGREPYEKHCGGDSHVTTCSPLFFAAQSDVLWCGDSSMQLRDSTDSLGEVAARGRGLGIVAGLFDEMPGIDFYVANDMSANHLWSPATSDDGKTQWTEVGTVRGVGLSGISLAQASMGIAAADPDFDGDIDFYVTHFSTDYNTFYEQVAPGSWVDRTYQTGMLEPTMTWLGFGTQWVDMTNHGSLDLFIANGHVNKPADSSDGYKMRPQLFTRKPNGRWKEQTADETGEYFGKVHLGRAVAYADLDRDRRNDLIVTHVAEPSSVLINQTERTGNSVRFYLRATESFRDAVGAKVTVTTDDQSKTFQLLAGDGYMCANEKCIHVGLGGIGRINNVSVTWPSGNTTDYGSVSADCDYLLVESQEAFQLAGP
ncbi:FG-GAP-like repeat-containing protein [Stieleria sp. JC731]|uniref:FG-GAP-like repeat-containing protein n=1 Tax=Pirellulaceae TaxID=2691357 RepID=UPI001E4467AD|nr:FG-GAP-like repeat-containing protein [Stieleria sp. JC731]MCC9599870.1 FG-GAP-like repeat-containing protein [Stieleria sp. JC731]